MKGIWLVARRDFWAYVNTYWGWLILTLALLISGLLFNALAMGKDARYSADVLGQFFYNTGGVMLVAVVFTTMRLFAEERQTGTIVLLESSPLTEMQMVLGKYLSGMMFLTLFLSLTSYMPALIFVNGKVSYAEIGVGYLGMMLMGSAGTAMGTWASAVSRNQLLSAVIAGVTVVLFIFCHWLSLVVDPPFKALFAFLAIYNKAYQGFIDGRINTFAVVYLVSLTFGFLLLATRSLVARRWE